MAIDLDGEGGSLEPFSALDVPADAARAAFIVEMDHFIHEKYDFRLLCIRYLAAHGWRWFGEELDHRQGDRVDRFLRTGDADLLDAIDELEWYTSGVLASNTDRFPRAAFDAEQRRFHEGVRRCVPDARWFGFDIGRDDTEYIERSNAANTFEELRPAMALRERLMHERVARVVRDNPHEKIALMAGSTHLMKNDATVETPGVGAGPGGDTDHSIGHYVANQLVDGPVISFWLLHGIGTSANPWLPPPGRLAPAGRTVDAELAERYDEPMLLRVGRSRERTRVTQMHNMVMTCRLDEQVDAIVFAPRVTPSRA
jgi:erythromycin esterase-like protein